MVASKDVFEPRVFLPRVFATGVFRGLGIDTTAGFHLADIEITPTMAGVGSVESTHAANFAGVEGMIYIGNDFDVTVSGLRLASDGSFNNTATLTVGILNLPDDSVIQAPVALPPDGNGTGGYRVTLLGTLFDDLDDGSRVNVIIDGPTPNLHWEILETVKLRG